MLWQSKTQRLHGHAPGDLSQARNAECGGEMELAGGPEGESSGCRGSAYMVNAILSGSLPPATPQEHKKSGQFHSSTDRQTVTAWLTRWPVEQVQPQGNQVDLQRSNTPQQLKVTSTQEACTHRRRLPPEPLRTSSVQLDSTASAGIESKLYQ